LVKQIRKFIIAGRPPESLCHTLWQKVLFREYKKSSGGSVILEMLPEILANIFLFDLTSLFLLLKIDDISNCQLMQSE